MLDSVFHEGLVMEATCTQFVNAICIADVLNLKQKCFEMFL